MEVYFKNEDKIILVKSQNTKYNEAVLVAYDDEKNSYSFDLFDDNTTTITETVIKRRYKNTFLAETLKGELVVYNTETLKTESFKKDAIYYYNWEKFPDPSAVLYTILKDRFCN